MSTPVALGSAPRLPITVAIPTYRRGVGLLRVLEDLERHEELPGEVLVIDQTPEPLRDPAVVAGLARWEAQGTIRVLRPSTANLPAARNLALREARFPFVLFLDDDTRLGPGLVAAHVRRLAEPGVTGVSGRVRQFAPPPSRRRLLPRSPDSRYLEFDFDSDVPRSGLHRFSGCNHSVQVESILAIGGYDERFTGCALYEDADAGFRLAKAGGRIVYEPAAQVFHLQEPAGGCRAGLGVDPVERIEEKVLLSSFFVAKHFHPRRHYWTSVLWRIPRRFVINKASLMRPWILPRLLGCWYRGVKAGLRLAQAGGPST